MTAIAHDRTGRALLAAILDDPADDDRRLICADWLEDHGEPDRAATIRHQIRFRPDRLPDGRTVGWTGDTLRPAERGPLPAGLWAGGVTYRRGFVAEVRCPLAAWERHGPALVAAHPIERVEATDLRQVWNNSRTQVYPQTDLPSWLNKWLCWRQRAGALGTWAWAHDSADDLDTALSCELIAWARAEAARLGLFGEADPCRT